MKFEATVRDLASDGRGVVVTPEGETCFVAGVWKGEKVYVEKRAKKSKISEARLLEIIDAADVRQDPPCHYHGHSKQDCGGCAWQFVTYDAQLQAKQRRVEQQIARITDQNVVKPIKSAPEELGYRNRAQLKTDGEVLGFEASQSNALIEITDCIVLSEKNRTNVQALRARLPNREWRPNSKKFNSKVKGRNKITKKRWTTLDIDESLEPGDASVNQRLPFQQANTQQNIYMRTWLGEHLRAYDKTQTVLELFCGSGNFTDIISASCKERIRAIELPANH